MPTQTIPLQKRAFAFLSALLLAMSMASVAPLSALAETTHSGFVGTIKATNQAAEVTIGDTIDMRASTDSGYQFKITVETEGDYHVDYAITSTSDGGAATINKHSGVLTPSEAGTVTVTAYLLDFAQGQSSSNPCDGDNVVATATKTVTIKENTTSSYGYQGNDLQIKLDTDDVDYTVTVASLGTNSYVNNIEGLTADNGSISLNFTQNYGIGNSLDIAGYAAFNSANVTLYKDDVAIAALGDSNFTLAQQGTSKTKLTLQMTDMSSGSYTITFGSGYIAGNLTSTLGATVSFNFTIS